MSGALHEATVALAETLAQENAALAALDLGAAAALLPAKQAAAEAFMQACTASSAATDAALAARLRDLAEENQRLLEHGIRVQTRVLGLVVRALPGRAISRYGATGTPAPAEMRAAIVSARA